MFIAKVSGKSKSATLKIVVVLLAVLFLAIPAAGLLSIDLSQASERGWGGDRDDDHDNHWKRPKFCSQTAGLAFLACQNEVDDDYLIAEGNCINVSEKDEREDCRADAREERNEGKALCKEQLGARLDLCDSVGEKRYDPDIDPDDFVLPATITAASANPYFPLVPGYKWTYKTKEDGEVTETITVEVLAGESITIEGVDCVVVRDTVYDGDEINPENIKEDTYDWYGQQKDGTVWYFGEFSLAKEDCEPEELCEGLLTEDGSWKSGYEGGKAGVIMFGKDDLSNKVGTTFRQELSLGNAEDAGEVLSVTASPDPQVSGYSCEDKCVQTRDFSPLEPDVEENKYYKSGIGVILEVGFEDGEPTGERVELIAGPPL